ncbi:MAG: transglycosylase SLT domain-containing protein [Myxococcales bacterium]|nr:transglycosylase SLT domain-containing protein [Myxococcales bacterium]
MRRASGWLMLGAFLGLASPARAQEVVLPKPSAAPPTAQAPGAVAPAKPAPAAPAKPAPAAPAKPAPAAPAKPAPAAPAKPAPAPATSPSGPAPALPPAPTAAPAAPPRGSSAPKPVAAPVAKKKGKPPRRPEATLPAGAARPVPNEAARRRVAAVGGSTGSDKKDPELEALKAAERVLFPKPLPGSTPGFSWDLPKPAATPGARVHASGLPPAAATDPGLDDGDDAPSDAEWIRSLTMPDLPVRLESRVVRYLKFYRDNPKGKAIARVWAKKSGRYVGALKAELTRAGLPSDLVWLSLIESGHNPTIVSPAGAAGLWQFMPEAGRSYGLNVDRWVDERYDPKRATDAAVLYLGDLYRRFGSWELAMAAYNMGYGGLSKAIRKFNTNDYWELCRYEAGIPWETTLYVPKIFALALVMSNKKAFGLADVAVDPPESFDGVVAQAGVPLERIAEAARVPLATIEALNPQILLGRVPPARTQGQATFRVRVPEGKAQQVTAALAKSDEAEPDAEPYVVKLGDDAASIAGARGTDRVLLARLNKLRNDEPLRAGTVLLVPKRAASAAQPSAAADDVVVISPREFRYSDKTRMFYRVLGGDTLERIARAVGVAESEVLAWNALDPSARLVSGMVLTVWVPQGKAVTGVRLLSEKDVRVLVAGTPEFFDHFEGLNGKRRISVEARSGDTLASLGRRYGMSVGWMERINRRSRSKKLETGEKLVVYVPVGSAAAKAAAVPNEPEPPETPPAGAESPEPAAEGPSSDPEPAAGG